MPRLAGLILGVSMMMAVPASADPLKDEIAPTGKLRVAIAISPAGGAFWSTKTEAGGYPGVPVDLGKELAARLGVPVEYVAYQNSGQIVDAVSKGILDGGHGVLAYHYGKQNALALWGSGPAFGMDGNMMLAWHKYGGGKELLAILSCRL